LPSRSSAIRLQRALGLVGVETGAQRALDPQAVQQALGGPGVLGQHQIHFPSVRRARGDRSSGLPSGEETT
jgi:hypothetical protein